MSSTLKRLTLGRRPEQDQARSLMLSRLGIAEEKPRNLFSEPGEAPDHLTRGRKLAAALIGWGLLTGDENSPIIQFFGMLLP